VMSASRRVGGQWRDGTVLRGDAGQATSEYVTILGMIVLATLGVLGALTPLARICADLARRIVLDLSS